MFFKFLIALLLLFSVGCSTPGAVVLKEQDLPLRVLQKAAVDSLPIGKRKSSKNGREFFSYYFRPKRGGYKRLTGKPSKRYYAHILVLGDRRPYTVEVLVYLEKRTGRNKYTKIKVDQNLSKIVSRKYKQRLTKGPVDRNMVDDFRIF